MRSDPDDPRFEKGSAKMAVALTGGNCQKSQIKKDHVDTTPHAFLVFRAQGPRVLLARGHGEVSLQCREYFETRSATLVDEDPPQTLVSEEELTDILICLPAVRHSCPILHLESNVAE